MQRIRFDGRTLDVARIFFRNALLSLLTVGFYRFWGRVRMRRYLWQHLSVGGHRLLYTGTGWALLVGFCKFVAFFATFFAASWGLGQVLDEPWVSLANVLFFIIIAPPIAWLVRASRLCRTRLCNVAFGMNPGLTAYWALSLKGTVASILTLGWLWPTFAERKHQFMLEHTVWGDEPLRYDPSPSAVRRLVLRSLPWMLLTFGLYGFWLSANLARLRAPRTRLGNARLAVDYTGGQVAAMGLGVTLATFVSLGLALPWVICRSMRFVADHVWIEGDLPTDMVAARRVPTAATFDAGDIGFEL